MNLSFSALFYPQFDTVDLIGRKLWQMQMVLQWQEPVKYFNPLFEFARLLDPILDFAIIMIQQFTRSVGEYFHSYRLEN